MLHVLIVVIILIIAIFIVLLVVCRRVLCINIGGLIMVLIAVWRISLLHISLGGEEDDNVKHT